MSSGDCCRQSRKWLRPISEMDLLISASARSQLAFACAFGQPLVPVGFGGFDLLSDRRAEIRPRPRQSIMQAVAEI